MFYFPIRCLKPLIGLGSLVSILVGLGALGLAIFFVVENVGLWAPSQQKYRDLFSGAIAICGLFSLVAGALGLIGSRRKAKLPLTLYMVISVAMAIGFLALTVFGFVLPRSVMNEDCLKASNGWLLDIRKVSEQANATFCITEPCYITRTFTPSEQNYLQKIGFQGNADNSKRPVRVQSQKDFPQDSETQALGGLLQSIETFFGCTGWCLSSPYFMFSDINKQSKDMQISPCYTQLLNFLKGRGLAVGLVSMGIALVLAVNVMLICCLINHPTNKFQTSYYQRFVAQTDDD